MIARKIRSRNYGKNWANVVTGSAHSRGAYTLFYKGFVNSKLNPIQSQIQNTLTNSYRECVSAYFNKETLGLLIATLAGALAYYYIMQDYLGPRETEILSPGLDLEKNNHHGYIVDSNNFEYVGPKLSGDLSGCVVRDKNTGTIYLKKGSQSKDLLIKEFLISTFLAKLRPGEQPSSLIMQEMHSDGNARLYTLSEIFPNSMDLEQFALSVDYTDELKKKPIIGLEQALASDFMFAKQADIKLANLIIIEKEDAYVVATIDHEMSGKGMHPMHVFTNNTRKLLAAIRDTCPVQDIRVEDPNHVFIHRGAIDFVRHIKPFMKPEKVDEFYEKVAAINMDEIASIVDDINGQDGVIESADTHRYLNQMLDIKKRAQSYLDAKECTRNNSWKFTA